MTDTDADLIAAMLANPGAYFAGLSTTDPRVGHLSEPDVPGYQRVPFTGARAGVVAEFPPFGRDVVLRGWFVADESGRILRLARVPGPEGTYVWRAGTVVSAGIESYHGILCEEVPLAVLTERR